MSRIIATALLAELRSPDCRDVDPLNVVNMLRLLDMYRTDTFGTPEPLGILEEDTFADLNQIDEARRSQRLKSALDETRVAILPDISPEQFATTIGASLRNLIPADDRDSCAPQAKEQAENFLSILSIALSGD